MKSIFSLMAIFAVSIATAIGQTAVEGNANVKTVSADNSNVNWLGKKVGGSHAGNIKIESGELLFEEDMLAGGSFSIDMTSINCTDLEGGMKTKLEGHLKAADFFDVENFPTAQLNITKVVSRGTPGDYKVIADLTIKGITNPVKFQANITDAGATTKLVVDRSEFNVRYGSGSFFDNLGDHTIYDEIEMEVALSFE